MPEPLQNYIDDHIALAKAVGQKLLPQIELAARTIIDSLASGGKILTFGNGGSAADAQHFAAELSGRYVRDRRALAAFSLTTDTSVLTAVGNDFGFDEVFSRQVAAHVRAGDIVVGITTSGNSKNVIAGIIEAKKRGAKAIALLGCDGGKAKDLADVAIVIPSNVTARSQEMHILVIHMICELVDRWAA